MIIIPVGRWQDPRMEDREMTKQEYIDSLIAEGMSAEEAEEFADDVFTEVFGGEQDERG